MSENKSKKPLENFEELYAEFRNMTADYAARLIREGVTADEAMKRANQYVYDETKKILTNIVHDRRIHGQKS